MPHTLDWEKRGAYWKYSGDVSGEEVMSACASIYGDPRFDSLDYKIVDFLGVNSLEMNEAQLLKIAFQDKAAELTNPRIQSAIVMTVGVELGEKFASYFGDSAWDVEVFSDIESARQWIAPPVTD